MAHLNPYLHFDGNAEEAMNFYKSVFGGEFLGGISRMKDAPGTENFPEDEKNRVMHISLPIGKNSVLMASDTCPSMGHNFIVGNNNDISVSPNSREEADKLFNGLSEGGIVEVPIADMFWGDYFGSLKDKFGISWMINYHEQQ